MGFELAEVVAELGQSVMIGGELEGGEDGLECTPKVRHENKGPITLNGESNADAPTTIFP